MTDQWYAIYSQKTGKLISTGTKLPDQVDTKYGIHLLNGEPGTDLVWNEGSKRFQPRPRKVLIDRVEEMKLDPEISKILGRLSKAAAGKLEQYIIRILGGRRFRNVEQTIK